MPNNDPTAIAPALTPDEWYAVKQSDREPIHEAAGALMQALMPNVDEPGIGRTTTERLLACMALANAAVHKDDPRKITREDVRALADVLRHIDEQTFEWLVQYSEDVHRLAAKLAALLPPEG